MLPITKELLTNPRNRPFLRDKNAYAIKQIKGIVAHWTANKDKGANAKANARYFNTTDRYASAHYIVDDGNIYQCIPDNEMAYHVGARKYKSDGERIRAGSGTPNAYLIGFEMCVNSDGDWPTTYQHSADLAAHLLHKYNLSIHDLYRHHDITGKDCPKMMLEEIQWSAFKNLISLKMSKLPVPRLGYGRVTSAGLNVRSGPGTTFNILRKLAKNDLVEYYDTNGTWLQIAPNQWVSANFVSLEFQSSIGFIDSNVGANVRKSPNSQAAVVDVSPNGALVRILGRNDVWLETGTDRWIHQSLVQPILSRPGMVTGSNELNVRQGPGTDFKILYRLPVSEKVTVLEEQQDWLRIGFSEWVYSGFIAFEGV
jgi:N-acetylmuramoyl-L-alanine amidase CwlA